MVQITAELIRKKSEHNESIMGDLEEITLHQLEIEKIEQIDTLCRKLKILYLQNNIINKIENLRHLKDLEYLNLALNNIEKIEGLDACEFLNKLDLTVNFIDLDTLAESMINLQANQNLRELFLVGNPCCDWDGCEDYVIAMLPQLCRLDGKDITRSRRIIACQKLPSWSKELAVKAIEKVELKASQPKESPGKLSTDETCEHTPQVRTEIYREMAEEKAEKEKVEKERLPRERNFEEEHMKTVEESRNQNYFADGRVRQCNEGKVDFRLGEDKKHFYLYVSIPRFVDTSLIDCVVEPDFVLIVVKNKVLRLATPDEVQSGSARTERSTTTGELKVIMPKVHPHMVLGESNDDGENSNSSNWKDRSTSASNQQRKVTSGKNMKLGDELLQTVSAAELHTLYKGKENPNLSSLDGSDQMVERSKARQHEIDIGVPSLDESDGE